MQSGLVQKIMLGICSFCKGEYKKREKTRKFCSVACANRYNRNRLRHITLPQQSEKLAEFIGICLGDGTTGQYQSAITLNAVADKMYIEHVKELAKDLFPEAGVSLVLRKDNAVDVRITSSEVARSLQANGIIPRRKFIPSWITTTPQFMKGCIRGLFDTEGSISYKRYQSRTMTVIYKQLTFRNTDKLLMKFVRDSLIALGFQPTGTLKKSLHISNPGHITRYRDVIGFNNPKLTQRSMIATLEEFESLLLAKTIA